jgi:hypothetical protein
MSFFASSFFFVLAYRVEGSRFLLPGLGTVNNFFEAASLFFGERFLATDRFAYPPKSGACLRPSRERVKQKTTRR